MKQADCYLAYICCCRFRTKVYSTSQNGRFVLMEPMSQPETFERPVFTGVEGFIRLEGVSKSFGDLHVIDALDLSIRKGETLSLVGNSGTGKSVLIKMLIGLLQPDQGKIWLEGREVQNFDEQEWMPIRRYTSMLFQANALFDSLTVYENIAYPLREHFSMPEQEISNKVSEVLEWVLLPGIEYQYPSELSGGMRKRIGVARAIVTQPQIVLYDEPTAGLDPISTTVVGNMIKRLQHQNGVTSIVITHDLKSAMEVGDRVALLHQGKVQGVDTPDGMLASTDPVIHDFFEGYRMMMEVLG